jgi:hypothetical protein
MHPSQVAFAGQAATKPRDGLPPGHAPGVSAGVGSPASETGAGRTGLAGEPALQGREAERLAARAEAAARAPWNAAIAFARAAKRALRGASAGVRGGKTCKMRSYPMRRPGVPACVTLEAGTLEAGAGRVGPQALVPGASRGAAEPGIRPAGKRFDWAAARAAKRAAKREARAASPRAGTGTTCEIRSYPVQPPARPAPVPAEPATGRPCPLALDSAVAPGVCPRAAEPGVGPMGQRRGGAAARSAKRAAKRAAKRLARSASTPAGTGTICEMRSYPMHTPAALAPAPLAPAAAEPARSGPCPLAIDPDPCNRGVEPGVGPMGQRRGRAAARSAKRAGKRAAKRLARGASTPAGPGSTCEMRS